MRALICAYNSGRLYLVSYSRDAGRTKGRPMQSMASLEELIASHPFFGGLESRFVSPIEPGASLRRFGSHQLIFEQGGQADHFYLILSGKVILETFAKDRSTIPIQTLGDGDALGWSWLFPPYQWSFTAVTAAPT